MKKQKAIQIISSCAVNYHTHLENKNLLFLFGSPQTINFFEAVFLPRNFLHLTGVKTASGRFTGSSDFYRKSLKGKLSPNDFSLSIDGTSEMKLQVLPQITKIHLSAKMVGDYSFTKSTLYTEKLVGGVKACLGFVRDGNYYIPNTTLKEDIRGISVKPLHRVLAILRKPVKQELYKEVCYLAKGILLKNISLSEEIREKISVCFG